MNSQLEGMKGGSFVSVGFRLHHTAGWEARVSSQVQGIMGRLWQVKGVDGEYLNALAPRYALFTNLAGEVHPSSSQKQIQLHQTPLHSLGKEYGFRGISMETGCYYGMVLGAGLRLR